MPPIKLSIVKFIMDNSKMDLRDAALRRTANCSKRREELEEFLKDLLEEWVQEAVEAKIFDWFAEHREEFIEEVRGAGVFELPRTRRMIGLPKRRLPPT